MSDPESPRRKDTARFECAAPASPARVRALARFIDDTLTALLGRAPADDEFTLVVSNLNLHGSLRAYTEDAARAGREVEQLIRNPMRASRLPPRDRVRVAHAMREGLQPFKDAGLVISDGTKRHRTTIDATLINVLRGIETTPIEPRVLRGTTETLTPIFAVGRRTDGVRGLLATLRVEAQRPVDVRLEEGTVDAALAVVKAGCHAQVELDATWEAADGETFVLVPAQCLVTRIEPVDKVLEGKDLLAAFGEFISADAADAGVREKYEELEIDWRELL